MAYKLSYERKKKMQLDTSKSIRSREQPNIINATAFGDDRYNDGPTEYTQTVGMLQTVTSLLKN